MKVQSAIYGAIGVVAALVLLTLISAWIGKKFPSPRYDERQKVARGNAYRFAFWVGGVCYLGMLILMINGVEGGPVAEPYLMLYLCMAIQALAFHMYCVITHSAMPFDEKPGAVILCYSGLAIFEFFDFFRWDVKEVLPLIGTGTSAWVNLIMGTFFLCLTLLHLISLLIRERE